MASSKQPPPRQSNAPPRAKPAEPLPRIQQARALVRQTMPSHLTSLLPKGASVDRFCKVFLTAIEQSMGTRSDLTTCTDGSLARAMLHSAEVNLLVGGPYPHAYVIPYFNKDRGANEAQFQISVWGYVELMRRSGVVRKVWADVIYANDPFECVSGTEGKIIRHTPQWFVPREQRGAVLGSYACALLDSGEVICEPVSWQDLMAAKAQNRGNSPAWDIWPDQQYQKVAIKRLQKYCPKHDLTDRALELDEDGTQARTVIDVPAEVISDAPVGADKPASGPLDQVVEKERAQKPDKERLVIDRAVLFAKLCDLDERWSTRRATIDGWEELDALASMAYVMALSKAQGPDALLPERPDCLNLGERQPGEEG